MMGWVVREMVAWGTTLESVLREGLCKRNIWADNRNYEKEPEMGRESSGGKGPEGRNKPCMYEKQKEVDLFVFESQGAQGASFS